MNVVGYQDPIMNELAIGGKKIPKFEREVEIDAPVEKVWEVITNPTHWPQWFPGVDSVGKAPSINEGGSVEWASEDKTGTATVAKLTPMKRLEIITQLGDDKDAHVFVLRPSGGLLGLSADECKVKYTLDTLMGAGSPACYWASTW